MSLSRDDELTEQAVKVINSINATNDPTTLDQLHAEYNAAVDQLYALRLPGRDTFALLPTELKYRIFEEFCLSNQDGPLLLANVCKQWLKLTYQSGDLWTNVIININEPNWLKHFEVFSRRSVERLIDITMYFPVGIDEIDKIASFNNLRRWKSLTVLEGRTSAERDPWKFPLRLSGGSVLLHLLQSDTFSSLKEIEIRIRSSNLREPYLWSNLFPMRVALDRLSDSIKPILLTHLTVNMYFTGMDDLRHILATSPGLTYLKFSTQRQKRVRAAVQSPPNDQTMIPLQQLRELRMDEDSLLLLLLMECPNLEFLRASLLLEELPLFGGRLRTFTSLKTLTLNLNSGPHGTFETHDYVPSPVINLTVNHVMDISFRNPDMRLDAIYNLLELFPSARRVVLLSEQGSFDWPRAIRMFPKAEHLSIEQAKRDHNILSNSLLALRPPSPELSSPTAHTLVHLDNLRSLRVDGRACNSALSAISAFHLEQLSLFETKDLLLDVLLSFMTRSPALVKLHLEGVYACLPGTTGLLPAHPPSPALSSTIQDLQIMHDTLPILQRISLPHVQRLGLMGVLQGVNVQRSMYHFQQREIRLSAFLQHPGSLLANLTNIDLCVANVLFPIIEGFADVLPHLISLTSITLPRALHATGVLIDALVEEMRKDESFDDSGSICPKLADIHSEDYPQWDALMTLLARRNRIAHIKQGERDQLHAPVPLECLRLPGLPHPSILNPLQIALAGKFPTQHVGFGVVQNDTFEGCDDCLLTGWNCLELEIEKDPKVRSSCLRHRNGIIRITADS